MFSSIFAKPSWPFISCWCQTSWLQIFKSFDSVLPGYYQTGCGSFLGPGRLLSWSGITVNTQVFSGHGEEVVVSKHVEDNLVHKGFGLE